jgi:hypothetical protein
MDPSRSRIAAVSLILALGRALGPFPCAARPENAPWRPRLAAELSAGPLLGLDQPLRGASGDAFAGLRLSPFEAGIRAGGAYDSALKTGDLRFDFALGLGSGLRAIVGGLLLLREPTLRDSSGHEAAVRATAADWPNRFGIAATIAELSPRPLGARLGIDAEIVYTAFRVKAEDALSGAAAFAASVEARLALRLRFGGAPHGALRDTQRNAPRDAPHR